MANIGPAEPAAYGTVALRVDGPLIGHIFGVFQIDGALPGIKPGVPGIPGRHNTVKKVHTPGNRLDDVGRGTHSHQVTGLIHRHIGLYGFYDIVHLLRCFSNRKAADGVAGQIQIRDPLHVLHPEIRIGAALIDAPQHLLWIHCIRQTVQPRVLFLASNQPAVGPINTLFHVIPGGRVFNALVKGHADIAAQIGLDLHTLLRAHKDFAAVNVRRKIHALFLDFSQGRQAEHLKSAGIR